MLPLCNSAVCSQAKSRGWEMCPADSLSQLEQPCTSPSAEVAQHRANSDRISAALGQKMLQGWALLDAYCPM